MGLLASLRHLKPKADVTGQSQRISLLLHELTLRRHGLAYSSRRPAFGHRVWCAVDHPADPAAPGLLGGRALATAASWLCRPAERRGDFRAAPREAIVGLIYGDQEWGVVLEIAAVMALDPGADELSYCVIRYRPLHDIDTMEKPLCFENFTGNLEEEHAFCIDSGGNRCFKSSARHRHRRPLL